MTTETTTYTCEECRDKGMRPGSEGEEVHCLFCEKGEKMFDDYYRKYFGYNPITMK